MITNFKKKQKRIFSGNTFFLIAAGILFLIISVLLISADIKIYQKKEKLIAQINSLKKEIQETQERNRALKQQISEVGDKDYIEKVAREELDLQKEGEKVVTFIIPEESAKKENKQNNNFLNPKVWLGWLNNGWQWIFSKF